jgi:hypothetical protein
MPSSSGALQIEPPDRKTTNLKVTTTRKQPVLHEFSIYSKKGRNNKSNKNNSNPVSPNFKSISDNPPILDKSNVRHININDSIEFNFDTNGSPTFTDNSVTDNNSIVNTQLNSIDNNHTTSYGYGNDSSGHRYLY